MGNFEISKSRKTLYFLTALILSAVLVRSFVFDSFTVIGNSMSPTIQDGDHVFVNKLAYWLDGPNRGDVVVGNFRGLEGKKIVKRVIALPDEWLWLDQGVIKVSEVKDGPMEEAGRVGEVRERLGEASEGLYYKLDPYEYFLSGDNEIASVDSFELGPVDSYHIDGKIVGLFRIATFDYITF